MIECKVLRDSDRKSLAATIEHGVEQTLGYMEKCRSKEGHLVLFDRRTATRDIAADEAQYLVETRSDGQVTVWTL